MLINLFGSFYGPEVIAAFSGAMLFTIVQQTFHGINKLIVFVVSFLMGTEGADTALSLLKPYLPDGIHVGKEIGAFVCSAFIVSVAMSAITRFENKTKSEQDKNDRVGGGE
ncbi:putative holin [Erwinia typographi]|uniref:putative holin n=1 Tax=Erwinia typographi TaxID=371042 RepID=UPI00068947CE